MKWYSEWSFFPFIPETGLRLNRSYQPLCLIPFSPDGKQEILTIEEKIDVSTSKAVLVTTFKTIMITFRNGAEMTMPFALTMVIRKVNGAWKVADYHNEFLNKSSGG